MSAPATGSAAVLNPHAESKCLIYQLLELVSEQGSNGVVEKVIINQNSVGRLLNDLKPGACSSISNIDFAILDDLLVEPVGIYGSQSALVNYLIQLKVLDERALHSDQKLSTGLYFIPGLMNKSERYLKGCVMFWPEPTTWSDSADASVKRNRVTFLRYLTKITDQIICLLSKEHSDAIVWNDEKAASNKSDNLSRRSFSFEVYKSKEQEESVVTQPGASMVLGEGGEEHFDNIGTAMPPGLVASETRQAIMTRKHIPDRQIGKEKKERVREDVLSAVICDPSVSIEIGPAVSSDAVQTLLRVGLAFRHGEISSQWQKDIVSRYDCQQKEAAAWDDHTQNALKTDFGRFKSQIHSQIVPHIVRVHPWSSGHVHAGTLEELNNASSEYLLHKRVTLSTDELEGFCVDVIPETTFKSVKARLIVATNIIQSLSISPMEFKSFDRAIATGKRFKTSLVKYMNASTSVAAKESFFSGVARKLRHIFHIISPSNTRLIKQLLNQAEEQISDAEFLESLIDLHWGVSLPRSVVLLQKSAAAWLNNKANSHAQRIAEHHSKEQFGLLQAEYRFLLAAKFDKKGRDALEIFLSHLNDAERQRLPKQSHTILHSLSLVGDPRAMGQNTAEYNLWETTYKKDPAHIFYTIQPLEISASDFERMTKDITSIPTPIRLPSLQWHLRVTDGSELRLLQLFEGGRYLAVVDDGHDSKIRIYLEDSISMPGAFSNRKAARQIDLARVGKDYLIAVDEAKRLVAIASRETWRVNVFSIDEQFSALRSRGAEIDLKSHVNGESNEKIVSLCFVHNHEAVAFLSTSGVVRIYSLVTEKLRLGHVQLEPNTTYSVASSPDGSCIFISTLTRSSYLRHLGAFHTDSWGNTPGLSLALPGGPKNSPQITSFGSRSNCYLLLASTSGVQTVRIAITTKASNYAFHSYESIHQTGRVRVTKNNSLLDSHGEVWSRYPVVATIPRASIDTKREPRAIAFLSESPQKPYARYFREMVRTFEDATQKPTGGLLDNIRVVTGTNVSEVISNDFRINRYPMGRWFIELFCLIPLHLAVTNANRLVPLKDGIASSQFESSLLGLNAKEVADRITLGQYESILTKYYANKPVKVVSSMGEQSVGKSYALNHFVDTSFAGSAMRCTEGAWLSITPIEDEIIVSLDFEGIHSIERTAQEDVLLVMMNVALSQLVLFRNNFALSRDVAGMFTSFQSSAALLGDPASHPSLFQSTLAVIIKDVVDSDADEIVREFAHKFEKIVRDTQSSNFITSLHRGQLDIIPWSPIQSQAFYSQMITLKDRLDSKPHSHGNAGSFTRSLKLLMARLQASDWASLDPNAAQGRVLVLREMLNEAMSQGFTDNERNNGRLKNLDSGIEITVEHQNWCKFSLSSDADASDANYESNMLELRSYWTPTSGRQERPDSQHTEELATYLIHLAQARLSHVYLWLTVNTVRFPKEQPEIQKLWQEFEDISSDLLANVKLCSDKCAHCELRCWRPSHHTLGHNCGTFHDCIYKCQLRDENRCGYPAGHSGNHICDPSSHSCGKRCRLKGKEGCVEKCVKNINHSGEEHLCSAEAHQCGSPCHLSRSKLCKEPCIIDCQTTHDRHICRILSCTSKCSLCDQLCSEVDHDHGLMKGVAHLCGREHPCARLCEAEGICEIAAPVVSRFKHIQTSKRRNCTIIIPAGRLRHAGPHVHSVESDCFHFCGFKAPGCKCLCDLPLGHPQCHNSSHGSADAMMATKWSEASGSNKSTDHKKGGSRSRK